MVTQTIRRSLVRQGMTASIQVRMQYGFSVSEPLCIYELCKRMRIKVRFVDINVEGMYSRGTDPRIIVAAKRPVARRAFTCAHELGHHVFEHGSTVDELEEERSKEDSDRPEEILANSFAAFTLMPTLGVRHAFASRKLTPKDASAEQMFRIACNFGAGYSTLIKHLAYGLNDLAPSRANELIKSSPKSIRQQLLGAQSSSPLVVVDEQWNAKTLDAEVGSNLLLPKATRVTPGVIEPVRDIGESTLYRATSAGIRPVHGPQGWAAFVRVCRERYVGLAAYRHLEGNDDEDDDE